MIGRMQINGPALTAIRERSGLSQLALAKSAGITQGRISELESGSGGVRPDTVKKLAEALAVPAVAFLAVPTEAAS